MIRILVDSSSDYTMEEIKEHNFYFVPLMISLDGKDYRGGMDLDGERFYELLTASEEFPKTSQPSPQDYLNIFREVKESGDELICILLSSALSGTYQSAVLAKSMVDYEKIYLIDSLSVSHAVRILAEEAVKLIKEGKYADGITAELEDLKARIKVVAMVDTMEYLYKGGRVNRAAAAIGEVAKIKPLLTLTEEGEVGIWGKAIGKNKAIHHMVKQMELSGVDTRYPIYTLYTYGTENCEVFESRLEKEGWQKSRRIQIGAAIGAHVGPGAFGVIYVRKYF